MIETPEDELEMQPSRRLTIRLNIDDLEAIKRKLTELKIPFEYETPDWGKVVDFFDPDGNAISIRDTLMFEKQIRNSSQ